MAENAYVLDLLEREGLIDVLLGYRAADRLDDDGTVRRLASRPSVFRTVQLYLQPKICPNIRACCPGSTATVSHTLRPEERTMLLSLALQGIAGTSSGWA